MESVSLCLPMTLFVICFFIIFLTSNKWSLNMATTTQPTITMKQISADLAEKYGMTKKQSNELFVELVAVISKNLKKGNRIRMAGLGILQVKKRAARKGRNPATGLEIQIPAKKKIAFRAAKELKDLVGK